jgi:C-terminal processing protease CtpA/Prc
MTSDRAPKTDKVAPAEDPVRDSGRAAATALSEQFAQIAQVEAQNIPYPRPRPNRDIILPDTAPVPLPRPRREDEVVTPKTAPIPARRPEGLSKSATCPESPVYVQFIENAANHIYNAGRLNLDALRSKYNCQIKSQADAVNFAEKEIEALGDPFTRVDKAGESSGGAAPKYSLQAKFRYQPGQIGNSGLLVEDVTKTGGAAVNGLKPGDRLVGINGKSLVGMEYDAAMKLHEGAANEPVALSIVRAGKRMELNVTRGGTTPDPVVSDRMIDSANKIAYVRIGDFQDASVAKQVERALKRQKDAESIIIDLRGNGGGRVDTTLEIAGLFMREGTLMSTRERVGGAPAIKTVEYKMTDRGIVEVSTFPGEAPVEGAPVHRPNPIAAGKRVVILTDGGTASSAEILTGALKDNGIASVVGTQTYGKGVGQLRWDGMAGSNTLLVTNMQYETPSGQWVGDGHRRRNGIAPTYAVSNPDGVIKGTSRDNQLNAALEVLRR